MAAAKQALSSSEYLIDKTLKIWTMSRCELPNPLSKF